MTTRNLLVTVIVSAGLISTAVWATEQPGETVEMDSLPDAVQKAIKDKAAGGEVTSVKREDDKNGKWNYEATIKKEGKEWCVEIAPDGKFVKKHENKEKE